MRLKSRATPLEEQFCVDSLRLNQILSVIVVWATACFSNHNASASPPPNSPLGINLAGLSYFSAEQPLNDIFKTNGGWVTHSDSAWDTQEENYLQLDSSGYPTTLTATTADPHTPQLYSSIGVVLERQGGRYRYASGNYTVLYDGEGKLSYGNDARLVSSAAGRDVINVAVASDAGIEVRITQTDPRHVGNHLRNIRIVQSSKEATLLAGGAFDPSFLRMLGNFRVLRFMDWLRINGSTSASWQNRPLPSDFTWAGDRGVPLEIVIQLANETSAEPWLNVPAMADDEYITQMAELVRKLLHPGQNVYVEYSNEVWNSAFSQYRYAGERGGKLWPRLPAGDGDYEWNRNWYGMRTAQMCDIWHRAWGADSRRVFCVMGAQAAFPRSATDSLDCKYWASGAPCVNHGIRAIAIAPYFGDDNYPERWKSLSDGGVGALFASLHASEDSLVPEGGWWKKLQQWESAYSSVVNNYHIPMIAYEGGQGYVGGTNQMAVNTFIAANRDPRMGNAYREYLAQWKSQGGQLFVLYDDIGSYSKYGQWGALESLRQIEATPDAMSAKWRAIQAFIDESPCWWPGCANVAIGRAH